MHIILESLTAIALMFYYIVEAWFRFLIPARFIRKDVKGQTVLITGAGSGLGRLMAVRFAKLGCSLVLVDVVQSANEETANEVREFGIVVHAYTCDLSKREDVYRMTDKVKNDVGDVDILINNAGIVSGKKILQCPDALIEKTMQVNVVAHFWTVKSFLPSMLQRNHGHVVTIASAAGFSGVNGLVDYCASKYAAVGFDESLRMELAALGKTGVRTTVVCPYYINTGMFEGVRTRFPSILPLLEPEYVADKILNAVLTNQEMLFLPRILYVVIGLKNLLPTKVMVLIADLFGLSSGMEEFRGRMKRE